MAKSEAPVSSGIFVSYRPEDAAGYVLALMAPLRARFGHDRIFKDITANLRGEDFDNVLQRALDCCSVMLVVIGPDWVRGQDPRLKMRWLDNPKDFIRLEIATALKTEHVFVIPVLVGGASGLAQQDLPPDLAELAFRNAIELSEARWHTDVERLIRALARVTDNRVIAEPAPGQQRQTEQAAPAPKDTLPRRIFLCYRRGDSGTIVGRIYDRLERDFGRKNIFKDVDSIPFGVDFVERLDQEVQKCDVLFAVIGQRWLNSGPRGAALLDDVTDFVRIEIASALRRNIPVVPVLVDGARMPLENQLPDEIQALARRQGIEVRHDPDFHGDMTRLLSRIG